MIDVFISSTKYVFIFLSSSYSFRKLNRLRYSKKDLLDIPVSLPIGFLCAYLFHYIGFFIPSILLTFLILYYILKNGFSIHLTLSLSVISLALSYITFIISFLISTPIGYLLYFIIQNKPILKLLSLLIIGFIQIHLSMLIFKIPILKSYVYSKHTASYYYIVIFISTTIIAIASFITAATSFPSRFFFVIIMLFFGAFLLIFWHKHLHSNYISAVMKRNIEILEEGLKLSEEKIRLLHKENERLSSLVHEDNKLIPTLHSALVAISEQYASEQIGSLIAHVEELSTQRKWLIDSYAKDQILPLTDNVSVNAAIEFLANKAIGNQCKLDFRCDIKIKDLIAKHVLQSSLVSVICDLGENAIIASKRIRNGRISINIIQTNGMFSIEFWDNGNRFDANVLSKLGKKRITTHASEGGSGIGLTNVYSIAKQCNASLIIDETPRLSFTKCIRLCFDGKNELCIITDRADVVYACKTREDIVILPSSHTAA